MLCLGKNNVRLASTIVTRVLLSLLGLVLHLGGIVLAGTAPPPLWKEAEHNHADDKDFRGENMHSVLKNSLKLD